MKKKLTQIIECCGQCLFKNSLTLSKSIEIKRTCNYPDLEEKYKDIELDYETIPYFCKLEDYEEN